MKQRGWIGFDLDGTLARYDHWDEGRIGPPIPSMVERVRAYRARGYEVRIVTARTGDPANIPAIQLWCAEHIGEVLPVTNMKDFQMICLFDDRAVAVEKNTGRILGGELP